MNSPIKQPEKFSSPLEYAPRWARDRGRQIDFTALPATDHGQSGGALDSDVGGNGAVIEPRRKLTLEPEQVPEPASQNGTSVRLIVLQMCAISGFAALVAWAVVSLLAPKQTADETLHVTSPSQPIVGNSAKLIPAQPMIAVAPAIHAAAAGPRESPPGVSASTRATNEPLQRPDLVPAPHEPRRPPEIEKTPAANILPPRQTLRRDRRRPIGRPEQAPQQRRRRTSRHCERKTHSAPHLDLPCLRLATSPCWLTPEKSPCLSRAARI